MAEVLWGHDTQLLVPQVNQPSEVLKSLDLQYAKLVAVAVLENSSQAARKHLLSVLEPTLVTSGTDKDLVVGKLLEFAVRPHLEARRAQTLGRCLDVEGRYDEALQQYEVSLRMNKAQNGDGHASVAAALNSMAQVHIAQGKLAEARALLDESLIIKANCIGKQHPDYATSLNELLTMFKLSGAARQASAPVRSATGSEKLAASPVRALGRKIANAFSGNAAKKVAWEDF